MQISSFAAAKEYLNRYIPATPLKSNYTLDGMRELMHALGNPQDNYKSIHVAGTSGKTSTCYYIASLLQQSGKKVGLTVSPHIDEINERVQINLVPLEEQLYCDYLNEYVAIIESLPFRPSYFEMLVAFAFWVFSKEQVNYAVIEVGMGGLLDGTNVITRQDKVCVVTDIGFDHMHVLGNTIQKIARQKAGIILPGNHVIAYEQGYEVDSVLREACANTGTQLQHVTDQVRSLEAGANGLPPFLQRNWHLAYTVFLFLESRDHLPALSSEQLLASMRTYIPARMEITQVRGKTVILDGAHNSQKIHGLLESVQSMFGEDDIALLVSVGKSPDELTRLDMSLFKGFVTHAITTAFGAKQDYPKYSLPPDMVASTLRDAGISSVESIADPAEAFMQLLKRPEPVLLVTGSFYLMNHIRPLIKQLQKENDI